MREKLVLVDGNSLMHRAFHALPLLDAGDGVYTNAVFGFLSMLLKVIKEEAPHCLAVAFDLHGPTFRHEEYPEYKAGRPPTARELAPQFDVLREILDAMHISRVSMPGFEADDLLGTLSRAGEEAGMQVLLVTGDRDAFQLAGPHTTVLYTRRGITDTLRVDPDYLMQTYGLTPDQMIDLKGLMGDASDNIPGIPGVGEKTALKLLTQYGSLEAVLSRGALEAKGKLKERLTTYADQAVFSRRIATIHRDAPVPFDKEAFALGELTDGIPTLERYKLRALIARLGALSPEPSAESPAGAEEGPAPHTLWQTPREIEGMEALNAWAAKLPPDADLALAPYSCATPKGQQIEILQGDDLLSPGIRESDILTAFAGHIAGKGLKVVCDLKGLLHALPAGLVPGGTFFDTALAAYALDAGKKSYRLDAVLEDAGLVPEGGRGAAASLWALSLRQKKALEETGARRLYEEIEIPLVSTLYRMEQAGFTVDAGTLRELGVFYDGQIDGAQARIYELAGHNFNLNSPKQLGQVLFDELGLPGKKNRSTAADVLEGLADDFEIARQVLAYRRFFKLKSTYIDALLRLQGADGRIHTSFDQTATATGRISSNEPNLQNIPLRTAEGREIRRAFVAEEGCLLVDADYSQIELRVMAHFSDDAALKQAFLQDADIHLQTAAQVYDVPLERVSGEMRSAAKAVNFGIIYGISSFGLARNIGVSVGEASNFIRRYLTRYPGVKRFMDDQVALGKTQGYVSTLFGRRRYLPELSSPNFNTRSFGERAAMNSPIQGTAADIIKLAMIRVDRALQEANLKARLILQVHDELIVEAPEAEVPRAAEILQREMEQAAQLRVPLKVELGIGRDWHACKA